MPVSNLNIYEALSELPGAMDPLAVKMRRSEEEARESLMDDSRDQRDRMGRLEDILKRSGRVAKVLGAAGIEAVAPETVAQVREASEEVKEGGFGAFAKRAASRIFSALEPQELKYLRSGISGIAASAGQVIASARDAWRGDDASSMDDQGVAPAPVAQPVQEDPKKRMDRERMANARAVKAVKAQERRAAALAAPQGMPMSSPAPIPASISSDIATEIARRSEQEVEILREFMDRMDKQFAVQNQYSAQLLDRLEDLEDAAGKGEGSLLGGLVEAGLAALAAKLGLDKLFGKGKGAGTTGGAGAAQAGAQGRSAAEAAKGKPKPVVIDHRLQSAADDAARARAVGTTATRGAAPDVARARPVGIDPGLRSAVQSSTMSGPRTMTAPPAAVQPSAAAPSRVMLTVDPGLQSAVESRTATSAKAVPSGAPPGAGAAREATEEVGKKGGVLSRAISNPVVRTALRGAARIAGPVGAAVTAADVALFLLGDRKVHVNSLSSGYKAVVDDIRVHLPSLLGARMAPQRLYQEQADRVRTEHDRLDVHYADRFRGLYKDPDVADKLIQAERAKIDPAYMRPGFWKSLTESYVGSLSPPQMMQLAVQAGSPLASPDGSGPAPLALYSQMIARGAVARGPAAQPLARRIMDRIKSASSGSVADQLIAREVSAHLRTGRRMEHTAPRNREGTVERVGRGSTARVAGGTAIQAERSAPDVDGAAVQVGTSSTDSVAQAVAPMPAHAESTSTSATVPDVQAGQAVSSATAPVVSGAGPVDVPDTASMDSMETMPQTARRRVAGRRRPDGPSASMMHDTLVSTTEAVDALQGIVDDHDGIPSEGVLRRAGRRVRGRAAPAQKTGSAPNRHAQSETRDTAGTQSPTQVVAPQASPPQIDVEPISSNVSNMRMWLSVTEGDDRDVDEMLEG